MASLFPAAHRFAGLPAEGFAAFDEPDREVRRRRIVQTIHPALEALAQDLLDRLGPESGLELHRHLPRLDWPRGYQPFCTWLALSARAQGYQDGPQLNVGIHRDHVALRLGWDAGASGFGRFEFLCRLGGLGMLLQDVAAAHCLAFRVYASAAWPQGSRLVFESPGDLAGSFRDVRRHGVWWELGRRHELPGAREHVQSPALGSEAAELFAALLPAFERGGQAPFPGIGDRIASS